MAITNIDALNFTADYIYSVNSDFKFLFLASGTSLPDSFIVEFFEVGGVIPIETFNAFKYESGKYYLECCSFLKSRFTIENLNIPITAAGSRQTFTKTLQFKCYYTLGGSYETFYINFGLFANQYTDINKYIDYNNSISRFQTVAFVHVPVYLCAFACDYIFGGYTITSMDSTPTISQVVDVIAPHVGIEAFGVAFDNVGIKSYQIDNTGDIYVDVLPLPCEGKILNFVNSLGIPMNWAFDGATQNTDTMGTPVIVDNFKNDLFNANFKQLGVRNSSKTVKLYCNNLNKKYWHIMVDIINSPVLRLYNGGVGAGGFDNSLNYVSVKMKTKNVKSSDWRKEYQDFEFEVELPTQYTPSYV